MWYMSDADNEPHPTNDLPAERSIVSWFEERVPVRGCKMSLADIKHVYRELTTVNQRFGRDVISTVTQLDGESHVQWEARKEFLLNDAFCLTVSIIGEKEQLIYGESADVFDREDLPNPIKTVYFNNITAWKRHASDSQPPNRLEVVLDFGKPPLLDPFSVVSEPTPNDGRVTVRADDMTYFHAVRRVVDTELFRRRTWYSYIHRSFAYDAGIWLLALPAGLIVATYYMEAWFPRGSSWEPYRLAFFVYAIGIVLLGYRFLNSYMKWAFPVNVLTDNKDKSLKHRLAIGGVLAWLFYKATDAIYEGLPFVP